MPLDIHSWPIYLLNSMGCQSIMPFSSWMCTFVTLRGCRAWLPSSIMKAIYFDNFLSPQKLSDIQYAANWAPNFPRPSRLMLRYRSGNQSQGHKARLLPVPFLQQPRAQNWISFLFGFLISVHSFLYQLHLTCSYNPNVFCYSDQFIPVPIDKLSFTFPGLMIHPIVID